MSHRLEQFVSDHREEFDSEEPGKKVWEKLKLGMEPPKQKKTIIIRFTRASLSVAAAVLLVVAAGIWYLAGHQVQNTQGPAIAIATPDSKATQNVAPEGTKPADTNTVVPDKGSEAVVTEPKNDKNTPASEESIISEEMVHYARLVELKHKELKVIEKDEPLLYKQFASDVNKLDSVYHSLQLQLPKNPNREQLLEAMLQNLQLQMGLLNHQLDIIKQINHSKKTAYEKAYKTA